MSQSQPMATHPAAVGGDAARAGRAFLWKTGRASPLLRRGGLGIYGRPSLRPIGSSLFNVPLLGQLFIVSKNYQSQTPGL